METLIIILIVVMIAQTCVFIYANFYNIQNKREYDANMEFMKGAQRNFLDEKEQFIKNVEAKDAILKQWVDKCNRLDFELSEARKVNGLLKNRTFHIEGLKDSFNRQAEYEWDKEAMKGEAGARTNRRCFVEGVKTGAEWICEAVGINVKFEIDGRFDDEQGTEEE